MGLVMPQFLGQKPLTKGYRDITAGTETASGERSAVTCTALSKLSKIGDRLVIPKDNHFVDLDQENGELKMPAGISLQEPGGQ
jgi:hypothetical protein